ncbi:GDSL esterase/lipase At5g45950 [Populus nigra]|uniref:GDSL esterase/lipase At5g45950 n=1 Tax=Populus nigra TaxID=3691 RepID=UPI002B2669E8|nr:GDSL esterase/lipase At5g45950 [Populus nigra]
MHSRVPMVTVLALMALMPLFSGAVDIRQLRQLAAKHNVTCVLVFGDSSVDPGNNNRLPTTMKGNFPPYGKDFFDRRPTGRFSNGRLATDFIAEAIGYTKVIPAFLDPNLKPTDLLHGVSFASAASGYDDLTANLSQVLPVSKQLEYLKHYKLHLSRLVGVKKAQNIVNNAIFLLSMGTNDFLQNYYLEPNRPKQFNVEQYQNFLASRMFEDIKEMNRLGATRVVVVGVPPLGCMPLVRTLAGQNTCVESYNQVARSLNAKIKEKLAILKKTIGIKDAYVDCYGVIQNAIKTPKKFGLVETSKGCCGSGTIEYGDTCRGMTTCADPSKYAFWDAVHPTEKMYRILADEAIASLDGALID